MKLRSVHCLGNVCVAHTHAHTQQFPRRRVCKCGGVQTHTEHQQLFGSQTSQNTFVLQTSKRNKWVFDLHSYKDSLSPPLFLFLSLFLSPSLSFSVSCSFVAPFWFWHSHIEFLSAPSAPGLQDAPTPCCLSASCQSHY